MHRPEWAGDSEEPVTPTMSISMNTLDTTRPGFSLVRPASGPHARDVACLTSLRFFAAAWVLALHYTMQMPVDLDAVTPFLANGRMGVDFFFILSGFILTHVYLASLRRGDFRVSRFVQKRLARLYPLHVVCILAVGAYLAAGTLVGVSVNDASAYDWRDLGPNLLLLHAWGTVDNLNWNYVSWSISAEWFAYLMFLPLSLPLLRTSLTSLSKLLLAFLLFYLMAAIIPPTMGRDLTHLTHDFGILRILPEFIIGIALYHLSIDWDVDPRSGPWLLVGAVVALVAVAHLDVGGRWAVPILAFLIFAAASLERQGRLGWLGGRALVYLGETSYSLYMVHAIVFTVYFRGLQFLLGDRFDDLVWLLGPGALVLALATASASYHLVEVPGRRLLTERVDLESGMARLFGRSPRDGQVAAKKQENTGSPRTVETKT